ncbi:hypothetical protein CC78DRAFT_541912 [Lojkania enalia]|uniref:PH domain-containing protein n=1 Tax=Lojkania enalia TaxID=147567 RepID=A0A9P4KFL6_9PLEO|nr:hypothetical protein CC78DRAFT_541912 [Didymosphaeria enalia]
MAATETSPPEVSPAKFSRYRSVRRAQARQQQLQSSQNPAADHQQIPPLPPMPPAPPAEPRTDATVSRSFSRYRARPTTSHGSHAPPVRTHTVPEPVPPLPPNTQTARTRALSSPHHSSRSANNVQPRVPPASNSRTEAAPLVAKGGREPPQSARDEAKQLIQGEAERQRRVQEKLRAEKRAKLEAEQAERERQEKLRNEEAEQLKVQQEAEEAEKLRQQKAEQERGKKLQKAESAARLRKKREEEEEEEEEEERRAKYEEAARKAQTSPPTSPPKQGGGFGLFKRRKDEAPVSPGSPPSANVGRPRQTSNGNGNRDLDTIRPGGGGAVLGIDAPISAVNAGDRRVMVVCNKSNILLPVTPTTTALDLIKSASTCLIERIDVRSAAILESFQKVGVTRPLRNYEHVRDVLNSWDDDKQNDLEIVECEAAGIDQQKLLAYQVPDKKPESVGLYIHYSTRPGKWTKRFFTLREDGQIVMSKSEGAKEQENVCHLSDFDIYNPTKRKLAKVKPPKKHCYAIKSQQKSNVFMDELRFVHFFCTNDEGTAELFYKAVQRWRSWYLKHVMGEGKKTKAPEVKPLNGIGAGRTSMDQGGPAHARGASLGSHYELGSFTPLSLDLDSFGKEPKEASKAGSFPDDAPLGRLDTRAMHARKMSTRAKGPPPLSYNMGLVNSAQNAPQPGRQNSLTQQSTSSQSDGDTFAAGGLLGRNYSQRQREMETREKKKDSGPFTEGSNLLNNFDYAAHALANSSGLTRQSSVRSHRRTSSDIQRSTSTRGKPKPLVDLTPQYKEPPQHALKGRGYRPDNGGPLIENATSLDEAIKVPSSQDWRSRPVTARPGYGTYGTGAHERTRSLKGAHRGEGLASYTVNNHAGAPDDDSHAFTGGGLLARAGFSQGNTPVGHGVMDGSKARGPMLDMREGSKFASGSLLGMVERGQGPAGPAIDRERSVELG